MDKKTKMILGAGVLGVGAYLLWKSTQPKKSFANALGKPSLGVSADYAMAKCKCIASATPITTLPNGKKLYQCGDGSSYTTNIEGLSTCEKAGLPLINVERVGRMG